MGSRSQPPFHWLPAVVLGTLISIIGWLLADKIDGLSTKIEKLDDAIGVQATEVATVKAELSSLKSRVEMLERGDRR